MRSTKGNATRFLLRRNLFIGVIVFLIAFYMMPVWGLSHLPNAGTLAKDSLTSEMMAAEIAATVSTRVMTDPLNLEMMVILYGGLGFMTAMMLMRHLFSRRQSMLQAALPDRRETDFLRRCVGYAVLCLAPILINFLLYLLVAVLYTGTVFGIIRTKWLLVPLFGLPFLYHIFVEDLAALRDTANPVSLSAGLQEISVLCVMLALLFTAIAMKKKKPQTEVELPKMKAPKVIAPNKAEKAETAGSTEQSPKTDENKAGDSK